MIRFKLDIYVSKNEIVSPLIFVCNKLVPLFNSISLKSGYMTIYHWGGRLNQVINQFCFNLRLNNTIMNSSFESDEFKLTKLTINFHVSIF